MLDKFLARYLGQRWFRRGLVLSVLLYTFHLTEWAMKFASKALEKGGDLVGTAGIVTGVSTVTLGLLTFLFKWYDEKRSDDVTNDGN